MLVQSQYKEGTMSELYSCKPFVVTEVCPKSPTNSCPQARSGHRIVCDDGNLYSFGGYNPSARPISCEDGEVVGGNTLFKELWRFNFASSMWKRISRRNTIPGTELASNAMVIANNGILMVYGGTGIPFGMNVSNNLYLYDIQRGGNMALVAATGQTPAKMYGQAIVLVGNSLYTVGGTTGYGFSADIHRLDLRSNEWEEIYVCKGIDRNEPDGRYRHEIAYDEGRIFVLGGGTSDEVFGFEEIPAFDIQFRRWEKLRSYADPNAPHPGIPVARRCHGCVSLENANCRTYAVIISGGFNGLDIYKDAWRLELCTMQWTLLSLCKFPKPLYFHSAAITPSGCMYTFGGIIGNNSLAEGDIVRTANIYSVWVIIPSLLDMSWEAFRHYASPKLDKIDRSQLLELGIPRKLLQQIDFVK